jgi:copper chaperone CopZ
MYVHSQSRKWRGGVFGLALALMFSGTVSAGGLLEVRQIVYGMDCAPCAHGVEKGLEKLQGVKDASVSLNEGYAALTLSPDSPVTLKKIQQIIRDNGFTPKGAQVVAAGTLSQVDGQLALNTGPDQRYTLSGAADNRAVWQQLQSLPSGAKVAVRAKVAEGENDQLSVQGLEPL